MQKEQLFKGKNALVSVFHKEGIELIARRLNALGYNIMSSGGTAKYLSEHGIDVFDIAELVGRPILNHKVVTLSREIHAGVLCDINNPDEVKEMEDEDIPIIHLVICEFYPLREAIQSKKPWAEVVKSTDIGGPTVVTSAAKGGRPASCNRDEAEEILHWLESGSKNPEKFMEDNRAHVYFEVTQYRFYSMWYHSNGVYDTSMLSLPE